MQHSELVLLGVGGGGVVGCGGSTYNCAAAKLIVLPVTQPIPMVKKLFTK